MMSAASNPATPPQQVRLRPIASRDLPALYENQADPVGARMAMVNPRSREEFDAHWGRLLNTPPPRLVARVIEADGVMVGTINCFQRPGLPEEGALVNAAGVVEGELDYVGYWLAREHWGRGIATRALAALLQEVKVRPLRARAASTNAASIKVLSRCGFTITGRHQSPADARYPACEETLFRLT
jgi:RimJ/RimL family protein N-acetyltransferase